MRITPLDIQQKQFKRIFRGFDPEEVAAFLELTRTEFEEIIKENNLLKDELRRVVSQIDEYREREKTLKETMLTAQKVTEDIKQNAKKDVELIVAEAQVQGDRIVNNAHARMVTIVEEISELKRQRTQYESTLRGLLDSHQKLLEITIEETEKTHKEAGKVEFLPATHSSTRTATGTSGEENF